MSRDEAPGLQGANTPAVATFTMKQAAEVAGVSVSTLRRRRSELEAAGALISPDGWEVPITALEALGLMRSPKPVSASLAPSSAPEVVQGGEALNEAQKRIQQLEAQNVELRHRAELAEAIARERAEALDAERMALRMLTAGPSASAERATNTQPDRDKPLGLIASAQLAEDKPVHRKVSWRKIIGL